jgi:hypothetical protein
LQQIYLKYGKGMVPGRPGICGNTANNSMSSAFVRESEEQWLHEVPPTINALIHYLTRENNGIKVYEKKNSVDKKTGREVVEMSNGLGYAKDDEGKWYVV